jgi:small subunit ribosomal protein S4
LPRARNKGNNPPGQHGAKRKRHSTYALQNREIQKTKTIYGGIRERQLRKLFIKSQKERGKVGDKLLTSLQSRLDNLVFRSGLVSTLRFSRQLVSYKHILVDGKTVNIPSYQVNPGQVISLKKEKMKENKLIAGNLERNIKFPPYLSFDKQKLTITYLRYPLPEELEKNVNVPLLTE